MDDFIVNIIVFIISVIIWIIINLFRAYDDNRREKLEDDLALYTLKHQIKNRLVNQYCELRFWDKNANLLQTPTFVLACREKTNGRNRGRVFILTGANDHAATVWAFFNMKFTRNSNYNSMKALYRTLRGNNSTVNIQENRKLYENSLPSSIAENEYCRMELKISEQEYIIICSDIWDTKEPPRNFVIKDSYENIFKVFKDFENNKNKFETFFQLKRKYKIKEEIPQIKPIEKTAEKDNSLISNQQDNIEFIEPDIPKTDERKLDI